MECIYRTNFFIIYGKVRRSIQKVYGLSCKRIQTVYLKKIKKKMAETSLVKPFSRVVETGIKPVRLYGTRDFKRRN